MVLAKMAERITYLHDREPERRVFDAGARQRPPTNRAS